MSDITLRLIDRSHGRMATRVSLPAGSACKNILKELKKNLSCSGCLVEENGKVSILLKGDRSQETAEYLVESGICKRDQIEMLN